MPAQPKAMTTAARPAMTLSFDCPVLCTALVDNAVITSDDNGRLLHTSVDELQRREVKSAHSRSVLAIAQSEGANSIGDFYVTVGSDERVILHKPDGQPVYSTQFAGLGDLMCVCIARCSASKSVHIFMGSQSTKVIGVRFAESHVREALSAEPGIHGQALRPSAVHVYSGHFGFVYSCCTMPWDSTSIATAGGDSTLLQWSIDTQSQQLKLRGRRGGHTGSIYCSAAHGGSVFTGSQDCTVRVWDHDTLACQHVLVGHTDSVLALTSVLRPGLASVLVSACASGQMRLWCLSTFTNLAVIPQAHDPGSYILCLCSHKQLQGHLVHTGLLSGGTDGTLRLWDLQQLLQDEEETGGSADDLSSQSQVIAGSRGGGLHRAGQLRSSSSVSSLRELLLAPEAEEGAPRPPPAVGQGGASLAAAASGAPVITRAHGDMSVWRGSEDIRPLSFALRAGGPQLSLQDVQAAFAEKHVPPSTEPASPLVGPAVPGPAGAAMPALAAPKCSVSLDKNSLVTLLKAAVSIPSVSSDSELRPKCWVAARFMQRFLGQIGAQVRLVQVVSGTNPVVLGKLTCPKATNTVVIHGHYDVQPAAGGTSKADSWNTDPFVLTGRDGYLYGRGASDNKGSLLAAIFGAARAFYMDNAQTSFVFLVEGEGENGSAGFREAIQWNKEWFHGTSLVLNTNNVWLDEDTPCLTYGMRGLLKLEVHVSSSEGNIDRHAGTDGGFTHVEPMMDLVAALAALVESSSGKVAIQDFYKAVMPPSEGVQGGVTGGQPTASESRWASPSLTVHRIHSSSVNDTVIPHSASSVISIRLVPDQAPKTVASLVIQHMLNGHAQRGGGNMMTVRVVSSADWWLADPSSPHYRAAAEAIQEVWSQEVRFVREGGTMRVTPFLQAELGAPAMHVPIGQASDGAHQINERISLRNLWNGVCVLQSMFRKLAAGPEASQAAVPQAAAQ